MCFKKYKRGTLALTIHHLTPREEGGTNDSFNLITLCNKCHNIAESEKLTANEIYHFYDTPTKQALKPHAKKNDDWHKWVYGGHKRPE